MAMQATRAAPWTTLLVLTLAAVGCGGGGGGAPGEGAAAPTLTQVSPDSSFPSGGIAITVRGSGFLDDAPGTNTVRIGNLAAASVVVVSDTELTCRVPAGVAGLVDVQVSNDNGTARLTDAFTYFVDPPAFQPSSQSVSRDEPGVTQSEFAEVCCAGDYVYAAWQDARTTAGGFDIYFNRSTDAGSTWLATDVRLDTNPDLVGGDSSTPRICCEGARVHVVWHDGQGGSKADIYASSTVPE
jgi:hypothetical protein